MRIGILFKTTFDNLENHQPIKKEVHKVFYDDGLTSLKVKIDFYIVNILKESDLYKGWDGEKYPKFEVFYYEAI